MDRVVAHDPAMRREDGVSAPAPAAVGVVAGASARATFNARDATARERLNARRPRLIRAMGVCVVVGGVLVLAGSTWTMIGAIVMLGGLSIGASALYVPAADVRAWATGALGEEWMGAALAPLTAEGFAVLHDLQVPGRRENIDHMLIGPPGVVIVETKNYGGRVWSRGGELFVNGRRKTNFIDQVVRQRTAVRSTLGVDTVRGYVCITNARFPWFGSPNLRGVSVVSPRELLRSIRSQPVTMDQAAVERTRQLAVTRFRSSLATPRSEATQRAQTDHWVRAKE